MQSDTRILTGQLDFSGGVDSQRVPTLASQSNPDGLRPNQVAWAQNATMRAGGVQNRYGWNKLLRMPHTALFQEAIVYEYGDSAYILAQIGGRTFKVNVGSDNSVEEVTIAGDPNDATRDQSWMVQGEEFVVIQDGQALPLFWDGERLRRSVGPGGGGFIVAAPFVIPEVGDYVDVELTPPFDIQENQVVTIEGVDYLAVVPRNAFYVQFTADPSIYPKTFPTGTPLVTYFNEFVDTNGNNYAPNVLIGTSIAPVTFIDANPRIVWLDNPVGIRGTGGVRFGNVMQALATELPEPAENHVYLVNLTGTPGTNVPAQSGSASPELPPGGPMDYYMGRIWIASGREYIAGDIVRGPSGTAPYGFRDSILKMTENEYLAEGGVFLVPTNAGNIRALKHSANLDTALGQGQLYVFTRGAVYSVNVPVTRSEWQALEEPLQRVAQNGFGGTSDRAVVAVNGDLFTQSMDGIRSFLLAIRYFNQWGNRAISSEIERAVRLNDTSLLRFGSGIEFQNRLYQTILPKITDVGCVHQAIAVMDFDRMSTLQEGKPPIWEGVHAGIEVIRLLAGDFNGTRRAFAFVRSEDGYIDLWEIDPAANWDTNDFGEARITWLVETPSFTWGREFEFKELVSMQLWMDQIRGTVDATVYYRPDQHPCWEYWHRFRVCAPRDNCEVSGVEQTGCYPTDQYRPQYRMPITLPRPPEGCEYTQNPGRPMNIGCGFQFKIVITGAARLRGIQVSATPKPQPLQYGMTCL